MCERRLRVFSVLLGFFFLGFLSPCYSEIVLTDEEGRELADSLQLSEALLKMKSEALEDLSKDLEKLEADYTTLQNNYNEQVQSSKMLKQEVRKYKTKSFITTFTSIGLGILLCVVVF